MHANDPFFLTRVCSHRAAGDLPIFLEQAGGSVVNATLKGSIVPVPVELRAPCAREDLRVAQDELNEVADASGDADAFTAMALPADPMLWAEALTGLSAEDLVCLESNEGA